MNAHHQTILNQHILINRQVLLFTDGTVATCVATFIVKYSDVVLVIIAISFVQRTILPNPIVNNGCVRSLGKCL